MCLYTRQILPIKAQKRIIVYKVVKRYPHKTRDQKYRTPCIKKSIQLFHDYTVDGITKVVNTAPVYMGNGKFVQMRTVEHGYIHCCTTLDAAKTWLHKNHHLFPRNKKQPFHWGIIKCWVEPGTLYYKSYDGTQMAVKSLSTRGIQLQG